MRKQFNAANVSEIRTLLNVALACLDAGEMDRLAWRIADAAGILREELADKYEGGLCGLDEPTGRGYKLPAKSPEQIQPVALANWRAKELYEAFIAAIQPAEEIGGPEGQDYIDLMKAVANEANSRANAIAAEDD